MYLYYFFYAVFAMFLLAGNASLAEARSHFLPDYQVGDIKFDEVPDIGDVCPDNFIYTAAECSYPNRPQNKCGTKYSSCPCDSAFTFSEADCTAQGKVGDGTACTYKGSPYNGKVFYQRCVCPPSYTQLTNGQICTAEECSSDGNTYCKDSGKIECESSYKICENNQTGVGEPCVLNGVEKYKSCACDEKVYTQTAASCKADFGENAVIAGTICGDNERGTSCSCEKDPLPDGYEESCGSQGYSETVDNGCGGTYYKCNDVCTPTCVDATGCEAYGTPIDNGCGGTCKVCQDIVDTCRSSLEADGLKVVETAEDLQAIIDNYGSNKVSQIVLIKPVTVSELKFPSSAAITFKTPDDKYTSCDVGDNLSLTVTGTATAQSLTFNDIPVININTMTGNIRTNQFKEIDIESITATAVSFMGVSRTTSQVNVGSIKAPYVTLSINRTAAQIDSLSITEWRNTKVSMINLVYSDVEMGELSPPLALQSRIGINLGDSTLKQNNAGDVLKYNMLLNMLPGSCVQQGDEAYCIPSSVQKINVNYNRTDTAGNICTTSGWKLPYGCESSNQVGIETKGFHLSFGRLA